jgi:ATP-binding cassette subfamily B protein
MGGAYYHSVAGLLVLEAEQIMLPPDHLLLLESQALPAIVVVRQPNGLTHFLIVWRQFGPLVQLMDPATGRRWTTARRFLDEVYVHKFLMPAATWREWAAGEQFLAGLRRRLSRLGVGDDEIKPLVDEAGRDAGWRSFAALDAATRMVTAIVQARGLKRGPEAARVLNSFLTQARADLAARIIPENFWSVSPAPAGADGGEQVFMHGAVLVRVLGRAAANAQTDTNAKEKLSPELTAALEAQPTHPAAELFRQLRKDGVLTPLLLAGALALAAAGVVVEALLFRGLFDLSRELASTQQRLGAIGLVVAFLLLLLALELPAAAGLLRMGRRLELGIRLAFLEKLPRLVDRYFQSRLISDMAERSHSLHELRALPMMGGQLLHSLFALVLTVTGIAWLDPRSAPIAALAAVCAVGLPLLFQPTLRGRDLRVRTHTGALGRFYLDALLGLVAIRSHGAERIVRSEHEGLLVEWTRAGLGLQRSAVLAEAVQAVVGCALVVWLLVAHAARESEIGAALLLVYWALNLPFLGQEIALVARQYPMHRNLTLRALEPLGAREETESSEPASPEKREQADRTPNAVATTEASESRAAFGLRQLAGAIERPQSTNFPGSEPEKEAGRESQSVSLQFSDVTVRAAGHTILEGINLEIVAGSQVAIVGSSGAGKSSLVGLLLGWHRAAEGTVLVDGVSLNGRRLARLREQTAWVDPAVHLWNRSLADNLFYGTSAETASDLGPILPQADLLKVLESLPEGLQTSLGEGGALLSGGEGQRVRFGRALLRRGVRLVILDEPFRGLNRERRRALLANARKFWQGVTLLCITHDVGETQEFDRVLVIENGRIVEDEAPEKLMREPDSRYATLARAEAEVRQSLWGNGIWRRHVLEAGLVTEVR